jgi:hypothetical protein
MKTIDIIDANWEDVVHHGFQIQLGKYRGNKGIWYQRCTIEAPHLRFYFEQQDGRLSVRTKNNRCLRFPLTEVPAECPFKMKELVETWKEFISIFSLPCMENMHERRQIWMETMQRQMDAEEPHFSLYDTAQRKKFGRRLECYVEPDGGRFSLRIENVTLPNRFKTPAKAFNAWKHGLYVTMTNEFKITSAITYVAKCILPPPPLECMHEQYDYNE